MYVKYTIFFYYIALFIIIDLIVLYSAFTAEEDSVFPEYGEEDYAAFEPEVELVWEAEPVDSDIIIYDPEEAELPPPEWLDMIKLEKKSHTDEEVEDDNEGFGDTKIPKSYLLSEADAEKPAGMNQSMSQPPD